MLGYASEVLQFRLLCSWFTLPAPPCAQIMTWHRDYHNAKRPAHGRLFIKYGGYFAREEDAYMPAFRDEHDGFWVSSHSTSKAISCGTLCADACHVHDAGRCTPCNPKHLSTSQTPAARRVTSQVVLPRSLLLSQSRCALRCMF